MSSRKLLTCGILSLLACTALFAETKPTPVNEDSPLVLPWLTGPLITGSSHVVPMGHWNFEPYFFANTAYGSYDRHWRTHNADNNFYNMNAFSLLQYGYYKRLDVTLTPTFSWNHTHGASHWVLNDMPLQFGIQLVSDIPARSWYPAIKLVLDTNLPIGKYQKLDPNKLGTDAGGTGSWLPGVGLNFGKLFHFTGAHFLATRMTFTYIIPNSVHVKGLNVYGGGKGTRGTVYPGPAFNVDLGLEYTITQNWALAFDAVYAHTNHTRFSGHAGETDGVPNSVGGPSRENFSIAPAFEYNWSENCGFIAGVWFSVAGRNSTEFVNAGIAVNIYR